MKREHRGTVHVGRRSIYVVSGVGAGVLALALAAACVSSSPYGTGESTDTDGATMEGRAPDAASACVPKKTESRHPNKAESIPAIGASAWSSPMSATVEDGVFAKSNVNYAPSRLVVTDFGFALPPDARVVGLEVTVLRMATLPASEFIVGDDAISVWRQDDAGVSSRIGPAWPDAAAPQVYGGGTDTWGEVLAGRDVDDASFGISLSARKLAGGGSGVYALVDSVALSVYYCE